jgi:hypothetical protein
MTLKSHILFEELLVLAFVKFIVDVFFWFSCWWVLSFVLWLYSVAWVVDGNVSSVVFCCLGGGWKCFVCSLYMIS